ncbi:hypothetical protein EI171_23135 [Bradyrhizobium sp. LCT2]|nr:hypothetical protein EI171_23135 [Bradyrhizobium sp. LCT2]
MPSWCRRLPNALAEGRLCLPVESSSDSTIRGRRNLVRDELPVAVPHVGNFEGKWNRLKNINVNNMLQGRSDHICVLFVQHPSENALHRPVPERSVVVCARTFGNCD